MGLSVRMGVDLGGTKIEIIVLDDNGATVLRRRVATPAGDYSATVRAIAENDAALPLPAFDSGICVRTTLSAAPSCNRREAVCCVIRIALCSMASR